MPSETNMDGIIKISEVGGQTSGIVKVRGTSDEMFSFRRQRERKCLGTIRVRSVATKFYFRQVGLKISKSIQFWKRFGRRIPKINVSVCR